MPIKKHNYLITLLNILIFSFVILIQTSDILDLTVKTATPMLVLPLLCGYAFFADIRRCITAGLVTGIFIDSVAYNTYCFNTVALMLLTVGVAVASNNLFNKNIPAAAVLSLIMAGIYYFFLWLFFYISSTDLQSSLGYLLKYALPSALYSAVFVFPFYYLYKYLKKIREH